MWTMRSGDWPRESIGTWPALLHLPRWDWIRESIARARFPLLRRCGKEALTASSSFLQPYRRSGGAGGNDDNPWHYKIGWNPQKRGSGPQRRGARYREGGREVTLGYVALFEQPGFVDDVAGMGFAGMPIRTRCRIYHMGWRRRKRLFERRSDIRDFVRPGRRLSGTGLTDDVGSPLRAKNGAVPAGCPRRGMGRSRSYPMCMRIIAHCYAYLGLFDSSPPPDRCTDFPRTCAVSAGDPAWAHQPEDKDMIVMQHEIGFVTWGKQIRRTSTRTEW